MKNTTPGHNITSVHSCTRTAQAS